MEILHWQRGGRCQWNPIGIMAMWDHWEGIGLEVIGMIGLATLPLPPFLCPPLSPALLPFYIILIHFISFYTISYYFILFILFILYFIFYLKF